MADNLKMTINKDNIENNIKNIDYYIERLQEIFNELQKEFSSVREYYKSNSSSIYFNKVEQLKSSFSKNVSNFNSYKADLKKLLDNVDELDVLLAKKLESGIGEIKNIDPIQRRD